MKNNQKGNVALIIIVIIIILAAGWYFLIYRQGVAPTNLNQVIYPVATPSPSPVGYQNVNDLDTASSQLDGTNLNQMDTGINQVAADSSSF